jgi:parallel beta-helix repeat protein
LALDAGTGSVISNNYISNNDVGIGIIGIGVLGSNECCIINHNKLIDNVFFGILLVDSKNTISNTKILGGDVGVGAIASIQDTVAILDGVNIIGAEIPIQTLSTAGFTASINVISQHFLAP